MPSIQCEHCHAVLPEASYNFPEAVACPQCQTPLLLRVFPAFFHGPVVGQAAEAIASEEDASCFYHPRKKAVVPCVECGRFLCALCDLDIDGRHLCPACAAGGITPDAGRPGAPAVGQIEGKRVLHDSIALSVAVLPLATLILWWLTFVTAPVALVMVIRYWNEPRQNPLGRTRLRLVLAGLVSLAILSGWATLLYFILQHPAAFRPRR